MPALVLCGHRTFVAGDDLRSFSFFAIVLRVIQLIATIAITAVFHGLRGRGDLQISELDETRTCDWGSGIENIVNHVNTLVVAYLTCAYIAAIVGLFIELGIWKTGAQGTPVEQERRACLKPLCHIKMMPMSVLRLGNVVMGVMVLKVIREVCRCGGTAVDPYARCPGLPQLHAWLGMLIGCHFIEGTAVGLTGIYFFCKTGNSLPSCLSSETKWQCCCRCCCAASSLLTCCLYGGQDGGAGDFADISLILADYFDDGGTLDVVATDIIVGLRVLARVQREKQSECRVEMKRRVSFLTSIKKDKVDVDALARIQHQVEDMEEQVEGSSDRLRLVHFQDEEMGNATTIPADNPQANGANNKVDSAEDNGAWAGRISLKDEEMGEVVIMNEEEEGPEDSLHDEDVEKAEDLAALFEEQYHDDEEDIVLTRVGGEKKLRRAVVFNLHRTAGGTLHYKPAVREVLSRKSSDDKLSIAEGARFMRFSMGIYSFRRYNTQRRSCEVCCALGEKGKGFIEHGRKCVNMCRKEANELVAGHDYLDVRVGHGYRIGELLEARFLSVAGLDQTEIKYVQFSEGVARTPYCISVDHAWKSIVIAIRGTEGFDDVVADLRMVPASMEECGSKYGFNGHDYHVHAGMLACAEWIYEDLLSHGIVDELLAEPRQAGYSLRLTGHSLGAGCAAILSFMIKHKYPSLKCSCFCPPGCTVSENMAEDCKDYLTSYVLDHDIVPRMSLISLENLRNDMLDVIASLKVTKFQASHASQDVEKDALLHREDSVPPSKFKQQLDVFRAARDEAITLRDIRTIPLYPPGKIVQLVKTAASEPPAGCCGSTSASEEQQSSHYAARWADVQDLTEIIISSHFLDDHSSPNVLRELERTAEVFGLSSPFNIQVEDVATKKHSPRMGMRRSLWSH